MWKAILLGTALLATAQYSYAENKDTAVTEIAQGSEIVAHVNGMVCDFCAQAVNKVFKKEDAVEDVAVNLDDGTITISCKPGETLADERVEKLVKKSGYALVSIDRGEAG